MRSVRLFISVAGAGVVLFALVGVARGGGLSLSSNTVRATFELVNFSGGFGTTVCALTLEGSLHSRTIQKIALRLIGYITRANVGSCTQGSATVLAETLPWHLTYRLFEGTLPNIRSITAELSNASVQIREPVFGLTCLYRSGGGSEPIQFRFIRELGVLERAVINASGPTSCGGGFGSVEGISNPVTVLNSSTRITLTLI
jgi:hypothetical protein